MYRYFYRQNMPVTTTQPTPATNYPMTTNYSNGAMQVNTQLQDMLSSLKELYYNELMNLQTYQNLLDLAPNSEQEEIIESIIANTQTNVYYLGQIYFGLTGQSLEQLPVGQRAVQPLSYYDLLTSSILSKVDTLDRYERIYKTMPILPYKDAIFEMIVNQLKDTNMLNYLIATSTKQQSFS